MMEHTAYLGDGEKKFALKPEMIMELERKTGIGIAALYQRFARQNFYFSDILETVRLGLIGGGLAPLNAQQLVDTYVKPFPIMASFPLALDILDVAWSGAPEVLAIPQGENGQAEAIEETLKAAGID